MKHRNFHRISFAIFFIVFIFFRCTNPILLAQPLFSEDTLERAEPLVFLGHRDRYLTITILIIQTGIIMVLIRNIRQKTQAQVHLYRNAERKNLLLEIIHQQTLTLEELVQACVEAVVSLTKSANGCICLYDHGQERFTLESCSLSFPREVFLHGDDLRVEVVQNHLHLMENYVHGGRVLRYLLFPVLEGEVVVAVVGLVNKEHEYDTDDLSQASLFMSGAWQMIARKQNSLQLEHLSRCDSLTGLPNRRSLVNWMEHFNHEDYLPLTLIMGDVNDLKFVNDAFGYSVGDELLKQVATTLQRCCDSWAMVGRWAGDQFVFLLPNTDQDQAAVFVRQLEYAFLDQHIFSFAISLAFGWETKTVLAQELEEIFKKAERHMRHAKLNREPIINWDTAQALMGALYEKSFREERHSQRVSKLCVDLGEELGLSEQEISELRTAGLFHDIGKITIESEILNKPGRLAPEEWEEIKCHPESGYRILQSVNGMENVAEVVLAHHERWDGSGYPRGLTGERIPFGSRVIAVADAYDAMVSIRPYRQVLSQQEAVEELRRCAGTDFDCDMVEAFLRLIERKKA